ncbi:mechanosensitive ion channel family protein [Microbacteriaceae bacterium 4G12]
MIVNKKSKKEAKGLLQTVFSEKLDETLLNVAITFIITYFGFTIIRYSVHQFFERTSFFEEKKEQTIETVLKNTSKYLTLIIVLFVAIGPFVNLKQLLLAGGVIGAIVGFGAQSAIKDFLYGFFFLFEGQLKKGDFVTINDEQAGAVEDLGFRVVSIRLTNGKLMIVPNGEIKKIINGNVNQRRIFESVVVDFTEDPSRIKLILESICEELNAMHGEYLLRDAQGEPTEPYHYWGLSSLDTSPFGFKFSIAATVEDVHYLVTSQETKFVLAKRLHEEGISLPSVRTVYTNTL